MPIYREPTAQEKRNKGLVRLYRRWQALKTLGITRESPTFRNAENAVQTYYDRNFPMRMTPERKAWKKAYDRLRD